MPPAPGEAAAAPPGMRCPGCAAWQGWEAQATLADKLAELAAVRLPFPTGAAPTEAVHWIASGSRSVRSGSGWQPLSALAEGIRAASPGPQRQIAMD